MGFGDSIGASHHQKKPITAAQLRRMQEQYKLAAQHIEGARQKEDAERQGEIPKIENDLMDSFL